MPPDGICHRGQGQPYPLHLGRVLWLLMIDCLLLWHGIIWLAHILQQFLLRASLLLLG